MGKNIEKTKDKESTWGRKIKWRAPHGGDGQNKKQKTK